MAKQNDYWQSEGEGSFRSTDEGYEITINADGSVFVCDYTGEDGGDMSEYEDEEDGLNPNIVKNDFPTVEAMVDYYGFATTGLESHLG